MLCLTGFTVILIIHNKMGIRIINMIHLDISYIILSYTVYILHCTCITVLVVCTYVHMYVCMYVCMYVHFMIVVTP
jgi:hypothetical protein